MGLLSNMRNKTDESESWLASLMDDESVPLDELEAATSPYAVDQVPAEPADAWHFPDLDPSTGEPDVSFEAAPFADDAPVDFDDSMLALSPISHEPSAFGETKAFDPLAEIPFPIPEHFDRRNEEPPALDEGTEDDTTPVSILPTLAERHTGPVGPEAGAMLEAFGLDEGASWIELRDRYMEMTANCRPDDDATFAIETELAVLRREINSQYASLRLLAAP